MADPVKPISPAELAALEHAFAADPSSGAYRPLTEAYLASSRFMEAMVVCKKGVKAHPEDPTPRVLLARIYAAQGKDAKALEELQGAVRVAPGDPAAHRMAGLLQLKLGEKEPGVASLRRAWEAAPEDPETQEALRAWGITFQVAPPPAPAAPPALPRVTSGEAVAAPGAPGTAAPPAPAAAPPAMPAAPAEPAPAATPAAPPPAAAAPAPVRNQAYADELASRYGTREYPLHHDHPAAAHRRSRGPLYVAIGAAVAVAVLIGWWKVASDRHARAVEIANLLRQTRDLLDKDAAPAYAKAAELCLRIVERDPNASDPDTVGGHAYLAYVDAIRWGEHGESEQFRDEARQHLEAVNRLGQRNAHSAAAAAYLRFYGGDPRGAVEELKALVEGPEGNSVLLHGVLGILQMQAGELDGAQKELTLARQNAPGDVRITQMLGEQWRRRGAGHELQAGALFDAVLTRQAPDHVPSLLGKGQLLLDAARAEEAARLASRVLDPALGASPRQAVLAHALHGAALHALGKTAEGQAELDAARALDPNNGEVHDLTGRAKLRAGDYAAAAEAFQRALKAEPARLAFAVHLATALLQRPDGAQQAVTALEQVSARAQSARVTLLLGDAYRATGDLDKARGAYESALKLEKSFPEGHVALSRVLRAQKLNKEAFGELKSALEQTGDGTPAAAPLHAEMADIMESSGAPAELVEKEYTAALNADPKSCPALYWLGRSRADRRGRVYNAPLAKQMLGDYLRSCPAGPRAEDARKIVGKLP